ncbi:hypothetical protein HOC01_01920 [archaeon]|jgi:uncharacterized membrane protein|nr:hypothetical protein [archaeon]MBT6697922.1 hypothetical protein [archaeon]
MKKALQIVAALAVMFLALASTAFAVGADGLTIDTIEVNGHSVETGEGAISALTVEQDGRLSVEVGLQAGVDNVENVEVEIEISGYEYDDHEDLEDESHVFDMDALTTKYVNLEIDLPAKLDDDVYYLRIRVDDKASATQEVIVRLSVEPSRHGIDIADLVLSSSSVEAGRSVLATVEVENFGDRDEEDVKVTVSVPALDISASDFIDNVEVDEDGEGVEYETSEEMFLSIPDCAEAGVYELVVELDYDEYSTVSESYALTVTDGRYCSEESSDASEERLVIAVGPESQDVSAGQTATFAVALSNEGDETETFTLNLEAASGSASLSESLVVLTAGESQVVYGYVAVTDAAGIVPVTLTVASEGETLETIGLTVDVDADSSSVSEGASLRNALEIALIVLVVLLVLVGLIIGFTRLRKDDDEEQTYY